MINNLAVSDRYAQFLISVWELCAAAHLAHLDVEICRSSGERSTGVPTVHPDHQIDWAQDGPQVVIWIKHEPVVLDQITQCTILSPQR